MTMILMIILPQRIKKTPERVQRVGHQNKVSNNENPIDMNLHNLTNQVLTLPREFRTICLSQDSTIHSENASKAASCTVNLS